MSYVRHLISETNTETGGVVRRYEVETPEERLLLFREYGEREHLEKLVELELRLTPTIADYFSDVPYTLAETIWLGGLKSYCPRLFCCADYPVLYYPMEPFVERITDMDNYKGGPIILDVMTEEEWWKLLR